MKNNPYFLKVLLVTAIVLFFRASVLAQCVIPITDGQPYFEDFDSGQMECWTVESNGNATWAVMTGTLSNVVAFQNADAGDEARLISPIFDMSGISSATFSFGYAMMGLYPPYDVLTVCYRTSEADSWHDLDSYSYSDWYNSYEASFTLEDLSATFQISFLGQSNGGYYLFVDNIEIVSAVGCARPVSLEATGITAYSALLEWSTTGNEESWTLELNGHPRNVDVQPFLVDDLLPESEYTFRVKANCGDGMESEWSYPATFKTQCEVITVTDDEPYFDDFEASEEFVCWQDEIVSGTLGWAIDIGYVIPNNSAFFIWMGEEAMLVSAPLDISAVTNPVLTFKHKQPKMEQRVDELSVYYATATNGYWTLLDNYTYVCPDWETISLSLPEASDAYYIAFYAKSNDGDGVYVDDVWVGNDPDVGIVERPAIVAYVMPNPVADKATLSANITEGEVVVFDLFGRQVAVAQLHEGHTELDMSGMAKGLYTAKISGTDGTTAIKLVKE